MPKVKCYNIRLPAENTHEQAADNIIRRLQSDGHRAFRVGGAVRDRLLGRRPEEVDVATDAVPNKVKKIFPHSYAVGESFGVIVVHTPEGVDVEVAAFREEDSYADGRHPGEIRFSTPEKDAGRRDFTVNSLFYDPVKSQVLDFVNGRKDLDNGVIRAIGDPEVRFAEDHLRILRAVRFAAGLKFRLDPPTARACKKHAGQLANISAERVYAEFTRMLNSTTAAVAFCMMRRLGILHQWLPEVENMKDVPQPPEFHPEGDVWQHTLLMLGKMRKPSEELGWAVLLHDVGKPPVLERAPDRLRFPKHAEKGAELAAIVLKRLRASNKLIKTVQDCVKNHMTFLEVQNMKKSTLRRLLARPAFHLELELHRLDCEASHGKLDNYHFLLEKEAEFANEPILPEPLVRGQDILALGLQPGPLVGEVLEKAWQWQLDGEIADKDEAMQRIKRFLTEKHGVDLQDDDFPS